MHNAVSPLVRFVLSCFMWCENTLDRKSDLVNDFLSLVGAFMIEEKGESAQILERVMSSYGVNTQKDLAAALEIPANNISGWTQRGRVPGNSIIKCALDTGADLRWLVTGELAKANFEDLLSVSKGEILYNEIISNGGKPVLRRIMDAYGFNLQKQLCELLGISSATVSTWVRRNYFPGDVVVTCAIDTGVSLKWLATGKGSPDKGRSTVNQCVEIPYKKLISGMLNDIGEWCLDLRFIKQPIKEPVFISSSAAAWVVDMSNNNISNGRWLLDIDDKYDIYEITIMPGRKIEVTKGKSFICGVDEVHAVGKVIATLILD